MIERIILKGNYWGGELENERRHSWPLIRMQSIFTLMKGAFWGGRWLGALGAVVCRQK